MHLAVTVWKYQVEDKLRVSLWRDGQVVRYQNDALDGWEGIPGAILDVGAVGHCGRWADFRIYDRVLGAWELDLLARSRGAL